MTTQTDFLARTATLAREETARARATALLEPDSAEARALEAAALLVESLALPLLVIERDATIDVVRHPSGPLASAKLTVGVGEHASVFRTDFVAHLNTIEAWLAEAGGSLEMTDGLGIQASTDEPLVPSSASEMELAVSAYTSPGRGVLAFMSDSGNVRIGFRVASE